MALIGLAYNLIQPECLRNLPIDCIAELDSNETIQAVADALQSGGRQVVMLEASQDFPARLQAAHPDIVFNLAEGLQGEARESQVPAVCELYGIPYTGSGILTLSICLNKAHAYDALRGAGLNVAPFQVLDTPDDPFQADLDYPLIIKLLHEGSSMGMSAKSVVQDEASLRTQARYLFDAYGEPVLVQKFITGREFTVGVLGNARPYALPVTEVRFKDRYGIVMYNPNEEVYPLIENMRGREYLENYLSQVIDHQSVCPAQIPAELAGQIQAAAIQAFQALECRDCCRIDFRLGDDGMLYVLELNPIAGIAPGDWLPNSAQAAGMSYSGFVNSILDIALERVNGHKALDRA